MLLLIILILLLYGSRPLKRAGLSHYLAYPVVALPTLEMHKSCENIRSSGVAGNVLIFTFVGALCLFCPVAPLTNWSSKKTRYICFILRSRNDSESPS